MDWNLAPLAFVYFRDLRWLLRWLYWYMTRLTHSASCRARVRARWRAQPVPLARLDDMKRAAGLEPAPPGTPSEQPAAKRRPPPGSSPSSGALEGPGGGGLLPVKRHHGDHSDRGDGDHGSRARYSKSKSSKSIGSVFHPGPAYRRRRLKKLGFKCRSLGRKLSPMQREVG